MATQGKGMIKGADSTEQGIRFRDMIDDKVIDPPDLAEIRSATSYLISEIVKLESNKKVV